MNVEEIIEALRVQRDEANREAAHWQEQYESEQMETRGLKVALAEASARAFDLQGKLDRMPARAPTNS